jgi:hypothetical protein
MFDVSADELFDAIDRLVMALLTRNGVSAPPVDAVALAVRAFGYTVHEEEEDDEPRRYGDRPKPKPRGRVLTFQPTHSATARNSLGARACAKELIADLLPKMGVAPGTENKGAQGQLVSLIAPRVVLPTRWYATAARKANADLVRLHDETFPTVAYEWLALRLLDLDEPCAIAIVDDGSVSTRRSNFAQLTKKLTEAEQACVEKVQATEEPQTVRRDGWTARGWPVSSGPFNRIILRSVPDDL